MSGLETLLPAHTRRRRSVVHFANRYKVLLSTAQYVLISLLATTFFYRELYQLQSFPQFTNQLNTLGTTVHPTVLIPADLQHQHIVTA